MDLMAYNCFRLRIETYFLVNKNKNGSMFRNFKFKTKYKSGKRLEVNHAYNKFLHKLTKKRSTNSLNRAGCDCTICWLIYSPL